MNIEVPSDSFLLVRAYLHLLSAQRCVASMSVVTLRPCRRPVGGEIMLLSSSSSISTTNIIIMYIIIIITLQKKTTI